MKKINKISINEKNRSQELQEIFNTGIGYRNPLYGSSYKTKLSEVMDFEVNELHNKDIFYTMKRLYKDYKCPFFFPSYFKIKYTLKYLANILDCKINELNCIWVTTKNNVIRYCDSKNDLDNNVVTVHINALNMIPISDLGKDGCLFVSKYPIVYKYEKGE